MKLAVRIISISAAICSLIALLCSCGYPDFVGNKYKTPHSYTLDFSALNRTEDQQIEFTDGDTLQIQIQLSSGEVSLEIFLPDGEYAYRGNRLKNEEFSVTVQKTGRYTIRVKGEKAKGKVLLNY